MSSVDDPLVIDITPFDMSMGEQHIENWKTLTGFLPTWCGLVTGGMASVVRARLPMHEWCAENCSGNWFVPEMFHGLVVFDTHADAVKFKLSFQP